MNISSLSKYALGAVAAAGILAGCSNGGQTGGMGASGITPSAVRHGLASTSVAHNGVVHAISGPSRVSPDKKAKGEFAYISDSGTNTIYVYNYSSKTGTFGTAVGSDTSSVSEPQGACAHKKDAWVTNTTDSNVLEFVNGSATSSGSLTISGEYPVGCSVDNKGDIAVSDIETTAGGEGNVEIFKGGKGTPTPITCSNVYRYYFLAYDKSGNVWVDGSDESGVFGLCEIKKGASSGTAITVNVTPEFPGGVTVAGKDIDVLDQDLNTIDQYTVSGTTGTEVGTVTLSGVSDPVQDWQAGKFVLTANAGSTSATSFAYPAGGSAVSTVSGLSEPIGVSVDK